MMQFTQNPAVSEPKVGGKFSLYSGTIEGEYISLEENKHLEMKWKFKDWGEVYSHVVIDFEDDDNVCILIPNNYFSGSSHLN